MMMRLRSWLNKNEIAPEQRHLTDNIVRMGTVHGNFCDDVEQ